MNENILKEFLVKLGFSIDHLQAKKMEGVMGVISKKALGLRKGIIGVAAGIEAMVTAFAINMEKLYYSSKLTGESAGHLQAFGRAARQFGVDGDSAIAMVKNLHFALQEPGNEVLLRGFGVAPGPEIDRVFALLEKLKTMAPWMAKQFGPQLLGVDWESLSLILNDLPKFKAKYYEELKKPSPNAEKYHEYLNTMKDVEDSFATLGQTLGIISIPALQAVNEFLKNLADNLSRFDPGKIGRDVYNATHPEKPMSVKEFLFGHYMDKKNPHAEGKIHVGPAPVAGTVSKAERIRQLELQYGLPAGMLDNLWNQESKRGTNPDAMKTWKGHLALGEFQFMTGKKWAANSANYGLKTRADFLDFNKESDAAARYLRDLMKRFHDPRLAAAGYGGWLGKMNDPKGQHYINAIGGILGANTAQAGGITQINQTEIKVTGGDTKGIVDGVAKAQDGVNAKAARDLSARMH